MTKKKPTIKILAILLLAQIYSFQNLNAQCKFLTFDSVRQAYTNRVNDEFFAESGFSKITPDKDEASHYGRCRTKLYKDLVNYNEFFHIYTDHITYESTNMNTYINAKKIIKKKSKFIGKTILYKYNIECYFYNNLYYTFSLKKFAAPEGVDDAQFDLNLYEIQIYNKKPSYF
jgi:hypothetical protein